MTAYGAAALDRECASLAHLLDGRHAGLCHAAFVFGQLVGAGAIGRDEAERALFSAVQANGYLKKRGVTATRSTIRTGLDAGGTKPRRIDGRRRTLGRDDAHIAADMVRAGAEPSLSPDEAKRERAKAQWFWRQRQPIASTIAETYLREPRGYDGVIPPTLAFLSAREGHEPAVIAAFGLCSEPEPGVPAMADIDVLAVQLVKLKPDGSGKADVSPREIIIGRGALGSPIVLAPANDLLGLAITEGIEDALSIHEATGLGAWASGGWARLPALADAVPEYVDFVTIVADRDPDGIRGAKALADRLHSRGIKQAVSFLEGKAPA